ncbi:MAG TPA: hypothetical protein VMO76_05655 [Candidatus Udaeobacter sp.]|nr:hypothetical protein [Candidatus Udaeobacter sp.]
MTNSLAPVKEKRTMREIGLQLGNPVKIVIVLAIAAGIQGDS